MPIPWDRHVAMMSVLLAALALMTPVCSAADYVWWEGERPAETNFPKTSWFSPETFKDTAHLLSEGNWLSASGKRGPDELFARYDVTVPKQSFYSLWTRKFWKHGPFRWRFGGDAWRTCGRDVGLADNTFLKQHVGANWVHLGRVKLAAGRHRFELRLLAGAGESATACFDAFLLTRHGFMPRGKLRPDERSGKADDGFFAWEPLAAPSPQGALLDLRHLNENRAGERGFVRREGGRLVLGNGTPVRFWAVNIGPNNLQQDRGTIDTMARKLAGLGVNMVRIHGPVFDGSSDDPADVDSARLDQIHYTVAALQREGIYTLLSFHFPLWFNVKPNYGIPGFDGFGNKRPFALLYFDPRMQAIHRSWARALLATRNPHTGKPLAEDPALAAVEIINEDSFFFWTFSKKNIPPVHWRRLEMLFGGWLATRYGSLDKAFAAWGGAAQPGDSADEGAAAVMEAWHMTGAGLKNVPPAKVRRIGDQVRFLAELQRSFYADTVRYYKRDLKFGGLVSCSNWHTADADMLDALERWTYTAGDLIDRHGYFGGPHKGEGASYSVRVGHTFVSRAAVTAPESLPIQVNQVADWPHIISEIGWPNPNRYRADMTFLCSVYGSLQGVDGIFTFAVGSNLLADTTMNKFALSCPVIAGTFPAAALVYRRGDVREAPAVVRQELRLEDLYAMKGSSGAAAEALDELRRRDVPQGRDTARASGGFDPLAFYVGRVERAFGDRSRTVINPDLGTLIDRERGVVCSATGELALDFKRGLATIDTPRCKAAAGFLSKAGKVALGGVAIRSANEYGSVWVVSLDDEPIERSRKILIQAMTEERPYGFRTEGDRITALGGWPFGVRKIDATVTLALDGEVKSVQVLALDENGCATDRPVTFRAAGGTVAVTLRDDAVYHVVSRW